jgi:predicted dehydrogenase
VEQTGRTPFTAGIGIIGCGYWGINYIRVFSELPNAQMMAICDLNEERLARVRERYPQLQTTSGLQWLLDNPGIDAVVVATPSSTHGRVVRDCLAAGKHVLVEKPFVMDVQEGTELVDLAEAKERILMVGHTFMYNAGIQKMKECLKDPSCGEVYYLHATRTNLGPIRKDANALWDLASHDVSIFGYLLDSRPVWVSAVATKSLRNSREDVGFIALAYPKGILGHIRVSWLDPDKVREVVVVAGRKRIVFNDLNNLERIRIFEKGVVPVQTDVGGFGEFQLQIRDGDIISPKVEASEPLKNECVHFLDCIANQARPLSDGRNGLAVVKVLVAIQESMRRNGAPVEVQQ